MAQTIPVYGSTFEWSDDGLAWAAIPKADSVVVPKVTKDFREITNLDSPNGFKEWAKGLKDGGEIAFQALYSKELWAAAAAKEALSGPAHFRVTLPADDNQSTGDQFQWTAHVTPSIPDADINGDMKIEIGMRVTGNVAWTQGAA